MDDREHQWQCLVRQVLRWRTEKGQGWKDRWLREFAEIHGQEIAAKLASDCAEQWKLGNRGERGQWVVPTASLDAATPSAGATRATESGMKQTEPTA